MRFREEGFALESRQSRSPNFVSIPNRELDAFPLSLHEGAPGAADVSIPNRELDTFPRRSTEVYKAVNVAVSIPNRELDAFPRDRM